MEFLAISSHFKPQNDIKNYINHTIGFIFLPYGADLKTNQPVIMPVEGNDDFQATASIQLKQLAQFNIRSCMITVIITEDGAINQRKQKHEIITTYKAC